MGLYAIECPLCKVPFMWFSGHTGDQRCDKCRRAMFTIKDHVKGTVKFLYYRDGMLFYETSETRFLFPVPISDIGTATFMAEDRAMLFMRYIRKFMEVTSKSGVVAVEGFPEDKALLVDPGKPSSRLAITNLGKDKK